MTLSGPTVSADVPEFTPPDAAAGSVAAALPTVDAATPALDAAAPALDLPTADAAAPEASAGLDVSAPDVSAALPTIDADVSAPGATAELPGVEGMSGAIGGSGKKKGSLFKGLFGRKKGETSGLPDADIGGPHLSCAMRPSSCDCMAMINCSDSLTAISAPAADPGCLWSCFVRSPPCLFHNLCRSTLQLERITCTAQR